MSASYFGGTIEQVLDNLFKAMIAAIVLIAALFIHNVWNGKWLSGTVTAVETTLSTKVENAATDVKAHVTNTAASSPRSSNGSQRNGSDALASTVAAAAENVASRVVSSVVEHA